MICLKTLEVFKIVQNTFLEFTAYNVRKTSQVFAYCLVEKAKKICCLLQKNHTKKEKLLLNLS